MVIANVLSLPGNPGPHSPMLDLDNDVRPSVLGHLSQTASLKRGSSFQSGRDDSKLSLLLHDLSAVYTSERLW